MALELSRHKRDSVLLHQESARINVYISPMVVRLVSIQYDAIS